MSTMISLEDYLNRTMKLVLAHQTVMAPGFLKKNGATEIRDILTDSIDKLPEKERMVVTLYYFEELTLKEIRLL